MIFLCDLVFEKYEMECYYKSIGRLVNVLVLDLCQQYQRFSYSMLGLAIYGKINLNSIIRTPIEL